MNGVEAAGDVRPHLVVFLKQARAQGIVGHCFDQVHKLVALLRFLAADNTDVSFLRRGSIKGLCSC